mmetsp:Transcript_12584/g.14433  ORF Transcript_12584/g.14433 Transcript_12584/m.14433 type:complete len:494 (-) Transcript_12584:86-1567(-)|eukprot:CAMPEP_0184016906 /NCGR_PEP_ID=MMETSP0954-20121128/7203_1 /TAXON_ID=627963 /ORGANISM="Aplanochytrium sp, Strain PBS07" /LENGTH=493 /DNA_ID=CAMNT_0026298007 /DNA_START=130 /DNA_END=1611 /DNA_ORIENTATION=+
MEELSAPKDVEEVKTPNPHFNAPEKKNAITRKGKRYRASFMTRTIGKLAQESDAKSSYVVGLLFFKEKADADVLKKLVAHKLLEIPRFRSKFVSKHFHAYFEELGEEDIDLDYHVQVAMAGEKPTREQVLQYVADKMSQESILDKSKPLWQITVVPEMDNGKGCLITNISHIIGDGMAQVEVLYRLIDPTTPEDEELAKTDSGNSVSVRAKGKRAKKKVSKFKAARIFAGGVLQGTMAVLGRPDPRTSLKLKSVTAVSREKRQALTEQIPLEKLKDVKNKIEGATINDVLIVLLTMCIKKYYAENEKKRVKRLTASFPINLRKRGEDNFDRHGSPHNVWAYGMMPFHLKYKNTTDLIWKVKKTLDVAKLSPTPVVQQKLGMAIAPFLTTKGMNGLSLNVANKSTVQLSNVAGPSKAVSIGGYVVDDMAFQLFSPLGLYVGIISYNGTVSCSINIDSTLGDPALIAKHWKSEFDSLYEEVMAHEGILKAPRSWF